MSNETIAIIPARKGSKGIPSKNTNFLAGKPLITHTIKDATRANLIDKVYVATDDTTILKLCKGFKVYPFKLPESLTKDNIHVKESVLYLLKKLESIPKYIVLLQPTGIFRRENDIDYAIEKIIKEKGDSLVSVYQNTRFIYSKDEVPLNFSFNNRPLRQQNMLGYAENGSIYITRTNLFLMTKQFQCGKLVFYEMPKEISYDVDTQTDFDIAEFMYNKLKDTL